MAEPFATNSVSACSRDIPLVSGTLNMTKKNDAAANSAYMAYVSGSEPAAITGKLSVMAKLATHCAAAARPMRAASCSELLGLGDSVLQTADC